MDHYNIYMFCNIVENDIKYPYHCPIVDANIINNVSVVFFRKYTSLFAVQMWIGDSPQN